MTEDKRIRRNDYMREYYHRNHDREIELRRQRREKLTPEQRADRLARRKELEALSHDQILKLQRDTRERNKERIKVQKKAFAALHRDAIAAYQKKWREANKERLRQKKRQYLWNIRLEMIAAYGGGCACCGETTPHFMTIDHIHNDGKAERGGNSHMTGMRFYMQLRKRGWPKDRYQLLCFNCNFSKAHFGICPHQRNEAKRA